MKLTAENTALVLDSTADFPDTSELRASWRQVPLFVRFGTESYREKVDLTTQGFYDLLRDVEDLPTTSQPSISKSR